MKTLKRRAIKLVIILFVIVAIAAVLALIPKAKAQMICGSREGIPRGLLQSHGEQRTFQGTTSAGGMLVVLSNPRTGTWTLVIIIAEPEQACILSAGEGGEVFKPEPESH